MQHAHCDFETFSQMSLPDCGAYRYAQDPSTEPLLFSWAHSEGPLATWRVDIDLYVCPADLVEMINAGVVFCAWNAQFERAVWHYVLHEKHGWPDIPLKQWYCVAAQAAALALPRALENAGVALGIPQYLGKDTEGEKLLRLFTRPRKPTKKNAAVRIYPQDMPLEWERVVDYNRQDVVAEKTIYKRIPTLSVREANIWRFDTKINERGLPLDVPLIRKALVVAGKLENSTRSRTNELTDGINPTQNAKLREWLRDNDVHLPNLQRKPLEEFMVHHGDSLPEHIRELLMLRIEGARVSVKKLLSMLYVVCTDHRARGLFLYWGARTGRWAGKLIQPHNYVRGTFTQFLRAWILELLEQCDDAEERMALLANPLEALSNVMRGFIAAPEGRILYVVDYANIESRIVVWLAGQEDVVDMYRRKVDLYRWMGSHVYNKAPEDITSEERRVAKHIVLGCGFGMGPPKFVWTCKEQGGFVVELEFAERCVKMYRDLHPKIAHKREGLWRKVQDAAIACVQTGKPFSAANGRILFTLEKEFLRMRLPSGRQLSYPFPKLYPDEYGLRLTYMSEHAKTHQWVREDTYGGKLVENAVQAIARDVMVEGMINAEKEDYEVDGTVHDELITERAIGTGDLHDFEQLVCRLPTWADGCPIAAEAFAAKRWRKQ